MKPAYLILSVALMMLGGWLIYQHDSWVWFCAGSALTISAIGVWRDRHAFYAGLTAGLGALATGIVAGPDQNYGLTDWHTEHWPVIACSIWALGGSMAVKYQDYWWEGVCGMLIAAIYIYHYVNPFSVNLLLIEIVFLAMMTPGIGGVVGRLGRETFGGRRLTRQRASYRRRSMGTAPSDSLRIPARN